MTTTPNVSLLGQIRELEASGVLAKECCPEANYWHWLVNEPESLPEWLKDQYIEYGEVRFYWF
jgi:hypothetical protein